MFIFKVKMINWRTALFAVLSTLVLSTETTVNDEHLQESAQEQFVKTKLENEIKEIKDTIKIMNSTLSDLTLMMRILNRKLDLQNMGVRALVDNLEKNKQNDQPRPENEYEKPFKQPRQENEYEKPFEQKYDLKTTLRIRRGGWDSDELWCYTEDDDVIIDNPVGWNTTDRAYKTLPPGLRLAKSTIPNAGTGVFTEVFIPAGVYFGPYDGDITYKLADSYNDGEYAFNIYKYGTRIFYRDAGPIEMSNWTRFINCGRDFMELNTEAFQCKEHVYFRTIKDIEPGRELFFFYGWDYAKATLNMSKASFCKGYNGTLYQSISSDWICE